RVGPGAVLGEALRVLDDPLYLAVDRVQFLLVRRALGQQCLAESKDWTARLPLLDLLAGAVGEIAHALGMSPRAVSPALQQCRAATAAGATDGVAGRLVDRQDVVAINLDAGHTVGRPARGDIGIARRVLKRHLRRELIVLANEQDRQLPDGRQVDPLVERAIVDRPVAEEGDTNAITLQQLETVSGARCLEDARADDPAGAHQPDFRREQVHAAAAALRAAGSAAEQLGEQLARRDALRQGVPVPAVRAEHDIAAVEVSTDAGGNGLLADVRMTGAVDQSALMRPRQLLLAATDEEHLSIQGEELFSARGRDVRRCQQSSSR